MGAPANVRRVVVLGLAALALAGCMAGPGGRWQQALDADAAAFWPGLWHGAILLVSLFGSFFSDHVRIYEVHNTGVAYDIGFVLGMLVVYGSGLRVSVHRKGRTRAGDRVAEKVERRIRQKIAGLVDEDQDWADIGEALERKVKDRIRRWLREEEAKEDG